ncbi:unnamed protein product [Linum tenue]|uniref:Uncharacterized protein n=1 Tax=Linum tenue TaxID=586396 RepID=A0AAV0PT59_9ROSI|nr:unnamed protein product [Linum tenue]
MTGALAWQVTQLNKKGIVLCFRGKFARGICPGSSLCCLASLCLHPLPFLHPCLGYALLCYKARAFLCPTIKEVVYKGASINQHHSNILVAECDSIGNLRYFLPYQVTTYHIRFYLDSRH